MAAFLEIQQQDSEGPSRIPIGQVETLGRDKSNTIRVLDGLVSRNHMIIRLVGNDQYYVMDAGSRNGCYLNGQRIQTPTMLQNGDELQMGETVIIFHQDEIEKTEFEEDTDLGDTISFVRSDIQQVTVLVADIRDYTTLSETVDISILSKLMTKWFYEVQNIIEHNGGHVDKFIGDCVMALWHTQKEPQRNMMKVLQAAHDINQMTKEIAAKISEVGELRIGVGINTGIAALGIGNENTAMGDTVNIAFRLEEATKSMQRDVVVSQNSIELIEELVDWQGENSEISVKGKKKPIEVSAVNFDELKDFLMSTQEIQKQLQATSETVEHVPEPDQPEAEEA